LSIYFIYPIQIVSQLKIFSAAIFSIILLNRSLVKTQWFSLITLFIGVCFVQLQSAGGDRAVKGTANQHVMTGFFLRPFRIASKY
jgi:UDP-sugar transporter A1/2/3